MNVNNAWPALPLAEWEDTYHTLHMWTQIVGKIRMKCTPHLNHWWEVPLYVCSCGLTTSAMPHGNKLFEMTFDFIDHVLRIEASDGEQRSLALEPRSVAEFYEDVMTTLDEMGLPVQINPKPQEVPDPIEFADDTVHASYDAAAANRFWRVLVQSDRVLQMFRSRFIGKSSPVHFFWGSFDLALTRFSGRPAPPRAGADAVTRDAYSHEVSSVGWWPGGGAMQEPCYYAYAAPEPAGYKEAVARPAAARYDATMSEFLLPYEAVRTAADPDAALLDFAQSTYEAAADLGKWDRAALERA
jgi:hypothetical protein